MFSFLDHCIWIDSDKLSLLSGKYFWSGVSVLANDLKISDITKKDFFQLKFSERHEQNW